MLHIAIATYAIAEKVSNLREDKNSLLDNVDELEHEAKRQSDLIIRMTRESRELKIDLRDLSKELMEKEEIINEHSKYVLEVKTLQTHAQDLKDEVIEQNEEIKILKEVVENSRISKHPANLEVELVSLSEDVVNNDPEEAHIDSLKEE